MWIIVEERLPEPGERVLVFCKDFGVQIGYINARGRWFLPGYGNTTEATHWQPLPEIPQE